MRIESATPNGTLCLSEDLDPDEARVSTGGGPASARDRLVSRRGRKRWRVESLAILVRKAQAVMPCAHNLHWAELCKAGRAEYK